MVERINQIN
jgi:acetyl-CoA acyltransferase 1